MATIEADPYPWPYNGDLRPQNTAVIVIDMQMQMQQQQQQMQQRRARFGQIVCIYLFNLF